MCRRIGKSGAGGKFIGKGGFYKSFNCKQSKKLATQLKLFISYIIRNLNVHG